MDGTKLLDKRDLKRGRLLVLLSAVASIGSCCCTRAQPQATVQSNHAQPVVQLSQDWNPDCPSPGPKTGTMDHKVTLTWNASASASGSSEIRYCIYRTLGRRVQAVQGKVPVGQVPCTGCELVNQDKKAVKDLFYQDTQVGNDSKYCYAAVAMQRGSPYFSELSKQVEAEIPKSPTPIPPFISTDNLCEDPSPAPNAKKTKVRR